MRSDNVRASLYIYDVTFKNIVRQTSGTVSHRIASELSEFGNSDLYWLSRKLLIMFVRWESAWKLYFTTNQMSCTAHQPQVKTSDRSLVQYQELASDTCYENELVSYLCCSIWGIYSYVMVYIYIYIYIYIHTHTHTHTLTCVFVFYFSLFYISIHLSLSLSLSLSLYIYIYTYVCIYIYICVYVCVYIYIYT